MRSLSVPSTTVRGSTSTSFPQRQPFDGIDVRARDVDFELLAFSSPVRARPSLPYARDAFILDVPARSQYDERG